MRHTGFLQTVDGQQIAYHHDRRGHDQAVIIAHGFYCSKDATLLQQLGAELVDSYDVLWFDFRGHGQSSGRFCWTSREEADLNAVLDYLKGQYQWLGLIAFSCGAGISINLLTQRPCVDALVCVSTPSRVTKIDYQLWRLSFRDDIFYSFLTRTGRKGKGARSGAFWLPKTHPEESVARLTIPVLYIHGERDWVVCPWHSSRLHNRTFGAKEILFIPNAPHAEFLLRRHADVFHNAVQDWFGKWEGGA